MENKVLDIFYNNIIPEAMTGKIDCYMYYNVAFHTYFQESDLFYECKINNKYLLLPTLVIKDKSKFDSLLIEYINEAMTFYDKSNFYPEVYDGSYSTLENNVCIEKVLLALLWTNATIEDFENPCEFLERRIKFFNMVIDEGEKYLGYSSVLNGEIYTNISKDNTGQETPYSIKSKIKNCEEEYDLPSVRFGISDDTIYIYAVQSNKKGNKSKKFNRAFYKVNENFLEDISELDNIKDITPSSLISLYIAMKQLESYGFRKYKIVGVLPVRWNSKRVIIQSKLKKVSNKVEKYKELNEEIEHVQSNLSEKFIRLFRRISYHDTSYKITSYPYELESSMTIKVDKENEIINNPLFNELNAMVNYQNTKKMD